MDSDNIESLSIIFIATNDYVKLVKNCIRSLERNNSKNICITIHILTNLDFEFNNFLIQNPKFSICMHGIDDLKWPYITLLRYHYMNQIKDCIKDSRVMYLDSDMVFEGDISELINEKNFMKDFTVVRHPAYSLKNLVRNLGLFSFGIIISNIVKAIISRSLAFGDWEDRPESTAYLTRSMRKKYCHGAIWFGGKNKFFEVCSELALNTDKDLKNSLIAKWHDESHLNHYANSHDVQWLESRFSQWKKLSSRGVIFSVDKDNDKLHSEVK